MGDALSPVDQHQRARALARFAISAIGGAVPKTLDMAVIATMRVRSVSTSSR